MQRQWGQDSATRALCDAIFSAAQSAAFAPWREVPSLIPNSHSCPANVYLPNWKRGCPAALDFSVISTLQQATIEGAAITKGHALLVGEVKKLSAYTDACQEVGDSFIPMVFETFGGQSTTAVSTIACLRCLLSQRLGIPPAESTRHIFQWCTISIWKGNAAMWSRRLPTQSPFTDGGF